MAIAQDRETFGRTRLSFANEADIDEFVAMLERFERGEIDAGRVARASACSAAPTDSGRPAMRRCCASRFRRACSRATQLDALADVAERYSRGFGHITTRQNIQFHFVKLHDVEPAMRELADGRPDHARGVRQLGAQHHGVPVRRASRRRGVRRHAVRRSADALPAAPSAQLGAAAQVQDRLRGLLRRITSRPRSTTSAGPRASLDGGRGVPRHRRRRHGDR